MKRLSPFIAGMLTTAVIGSIAITGLAASGAVSFNTVNLTFSGKTLSAAGEDFTLSSGASVPASITYTDENGGGTTYLPVARLGELLGVQIGWDQDTKSVAIGSAETPPTTPPAETPPTTPPADAWTAEEEAAYQEFKGMWEVVNDKNDRAQIVSATYRGNMTKNELIDRLTKNHDYISRLASESVDAKPASVYFSIYWNDDQIGNVSMLGKTVQAIAIAEPQNLADEMDYEEFKELWNISTRYDSTTQFIRLTYRGSGTKDDVIALLYENLGNMSRIATETVSPKYPGTSFCFYWDDKIIGAVGIWATQGKIAVIQIDGTEIFPK